MVYASMVALMGNLVGLLGSFNIMLCGQVFQESTVAEG